MSAQQKATVELLKGSIFEGEIVKYQYGDTLFLLIDKGIVIKFPESTIKELSFNKNKTTHLYNPKKLLNSTRFALDMGETKNGFSLSHTIYLMAFSNFYYGVGGGIDNHYGEENYNVFPIFGASRYYLLKRRISPFLDVKVGYGMAFKQLRNNLIDANGGFHFNPTFGYRFGTKYFASELTFGVKIQKVDYLYQSAQESIEYNILVKRLQVGFNFTF